MEEEEDVAETMSREMGKPIAQTLDEVDKCAWSCRHYAESATGYLAEEEIELGNQRSYICFEPLGVVLEVMPWNFSFWQVFRFAVPALVAGNTCLLKHDLERPDVLHEDSGGIRGHGLPRGYVYVSPSHLRDRHGDAPNGVGR